MASTITATLVAAGDGITWPDMAAAAGAREHEPAGVGRLAGLAEWLAATQGNWPARPPRRPRLFVVGKVDQVAAELASTLDVGVREVDASVDAQAALAAATAVADDEVDSGTDLIVLAAPATEPEADAARVLVSALAEAEPVALLPRGAAAVDSGAWIAAATRLRDARRSAGPLRAAPDELLAVLGSPTLSACAGIVLRAVARRTPVVLDGASAVAVALLCRVAHPRVARWLRIADTSPDPVHARACAELDQRPLLDLGTTRGDGTAGLLCLPLLRAAAALAGTGASPESVETAGR